ncbi:binding protein [Striga asiatica]|uniref:Binding protein n=1 Tax=Striga asiatica TaxID=4170 RepID=A0A5A7RGB5_STRAF|nr:binding protein [Striga asiatica]
MVEDSFEVEEWDADFLDQLVQAEELALSTQRPRHAPSQLPPPPPSLLSPTFLPHPAAPRVPPCDVSYSPPRELSQRTREIPRAEDVPDSTGSFGAIANHFAKEQENDRLKKELQGVSKQLHQLEHEILELRKEKDKKEEELKVLQSKVEAKDAEFQNTKNAEIPTAPGISMECQNAKPSNDKLSSSSIRSSEKLFNLWNSDDQKQGKTLVAKLFMTCEADFHVLFGYLNSPQKDFSRGTQTTETAKVSHLYSVLTKLQISNDTSRLGELLRALTDLCNLKNVAIVRGSIRILHHLLSNSFSLEKEDCKRENIIFEEKSHIISDTNGSEDPESERLCSANVAEMLKQGRVLSGLELSNIKIPGCIGFFDHRFGTSISGAFWVSLFETICAVATENNEKQIRREALSIMNLILMRQNAYLERDGFAGELVFRSLSNLLRKEAGFSVQDQAVHTLYLLCNSPKVVPLLCSNYEEDGALATSNDITNRSGSTFNGLNEILIGLADCLACYRSASAEVSLPFQLFRRLQFQGEMKLRRNAISLLAFVGSAGKSSLEILLNHRLPKGTNFLVIILQSLASDLDPEALNSAKQSGIVKEQCLLIREALIFLNRLVSHPDYSVPVLQALTDTRELASTTVDIANILTRNSNLLWKDISSKKHVRESEITDLARVFKKRVFTFLGDSIS